MKKISRRAAVRSVSASALVGLGAKAIAAGSTNESDPEAERHVRSMTLDEFRTMNAPVAAEDLFRHIEGHTFSMCHKDMRDKHGIWIPELVPVFEKLDAMRANSI